MPHDYNPKTRKFVTNGREVPRREVRSLIDKLTDQVKADATRIGRKLEAGKITVAEFESEMRALLKSAHIVAATVGKGGKVRMTQSDWGTVGAKLKSEYGYLAKLSRRLSTGRVAKVSSANRAKNYASGVVMSYHKTVRQEETAGTSEIKVRLITNSQEGCEECAADEARGWVNVNDMDELGTRICGNFCKCDLEFEDDVNVE